MRVRALALAASLTLSAVSGAVADGLQVAVGKALFDRVWAPAPASTRATDGLGPLFNARSCSACHHAGGGAALDPRGKPTGTGLVLRLPDDPVYGAQLQTGGMQGQPAEGELVVRWQEVPRSLADGTVVHLRRPEIGILRPAYGPPPRHLSPRLAPSLHGVGLLATVPAAAIAARADPADRDGDGISGRIGAGRFGLRAEEPTLRAQVQAAMLLDLGLGTSAQPRPAGDCTATQADCLAAPHGDDGPTVGVEIGDEMVDALVAYLAALPAPAPTAGGSDGGGAALFASLGCAACHIPTLPAVTRRGAPITIEPYTDLLLHDLGPELADQGAAGEPTARLWRTAPLWSLGKAGAAGPATLLHDGRARDPQEAILWHGGEALATRERYRDLAAADRARLLAFLASL